MTNYVSFICTLTPCGWYDVKLKSGGGVARLSICICAQVMLTAHGVQVQISMVSGRGPVISW
jgi:hypothetical protein